MFHIKAYFFSCSDKKPKSIQLYICSKWFSESNALQNWSIVPHEAMAPWSAWSPLPRAPRAEFPTHKTQHYLLIFPSLPCLTHVFRICFQYQKQQMEPIQGQMSYVLMEQMYSCSCSVVSILASLIKSQTSRSAQMNQLCRSHRET